MELYILFSPTLSSLRLRCLLLCFINTAQSRDFVELENEFYQHRIARVARNFVYHICGFYARAFLIFLWE